MSFRSWSVAGALLLGAPALHHPGVAPGSDIPGGTLSGLGGVGVPGDVPGGTLSGLGGVGVPGMLPGGTLAPPLTGAEAPPIFFPGLVVPEPAPLPGFGDPVSGPAGQWPPERAWRGGRGGTVHR